MVTATNITARIDAILTGKMCQSSNYAKLGMPANMLNNQIIMLSNIRQMVNHGWTLVQLEKTDCFIKKYE